MTFIHWGVINLIGFSLKLIALTWLTVIILPVQIKEAKVKDGIYKLRRLLLLSLATYYFFNFVYMLICAQRIIFGVRDFYADIYSFITGVSVMSITVIAHLIYRLRFAKD